MKAFHLYLLGTGSWFLAFGIQSVMFAWLVTMELHEVPQMVGIAQMTMLIPTMLLILIGGSLADIIGGRRIVIVAQSIAALPPLFLFIVVLHRQPQLQGDDLLRDRNGHRAGVRHAGARWSA